MASFLSSLSFLPLLPKLHPSSQTSHSPIPRTLPSPSQKILLSPATTQSLQSETESVDWIASSVTRRFGIGAGLACVGCGFLFDSYQKYADIGWFLILFHCYIFRSCYCLIILFTFNRLFWVLNLGGLNFPFVFCSSMMNITNPPPHDNPFEIIWLCIAFPWKTIKDVIFHWTNTVIFGCNSDFKKEKEVVLANGIRYVYIH